MDRVWRCVPTTLSLVAVLAACGSEPSSVRNPDWGKDAAGTSFPDAGIASGGAHAGGAAGAKGSGGAAGATSSGGATTEAGTDAAGAPPGAGGGGAEAGADAGRDANVVR